MDLFPAFLSISLAVFLATTSYANDVFRCPTVLPRDRYLKASSWEVCYQFHIEERPWTTARNVCSRLGGQLVTIKEARIQEFLIESLSELRWPRRGLWLGANDKKSEMDWRWITGDKVRNGYSNWAPGQPSCGLFCFEDCAIMRWREKDGRWHDFRCNWMEYSFICEFDMLPRITPTTTTPTTTTTTTTTTTPTTTTTTITTTTTTTTTPTTTTSTSTSTKNTTAREFNVLKKNLQSDYRLNSSARKNHSAPNVYLHGANNARHGQVKQVESQSAGLTSGSLVGLVVGILIGLSCAVCFIFFILLRRRKRKQSLEQDPQMIFDNPYYAETPVIYRGNGNQREDNDNDDNDRNGGNTSDNIGFASGGCNDEDSVYLKPQLKGCVDSSQETLKLKLPPPPSPLHSKPRLVMNDYDTPPTLTAPTRITTGASGRSSSLNKKEKKKGTRNDKNKSISAATSDEEEIYYSEVRPHPRTSNGYTYDIPQSQNVMDYANGAAACAAIVNRDKDNDFSENDYYNEEENMYESLEHLNVGSNMEDGEETKRLMSSFTSPNEQRDVTQFEAEDIYVNGPKENNYVPLKAGDNIYY